MKNSSTFRTVCNVLAANFGSPLNEWLAVTVQPKILCGLGAALRICFPACIPTDFEDADSGWLCVSDRFAVEAWRRADAGEVSG